MISTIFLTIIWLNIIPIIIGFGIFKNKSVAEALLLGLYFEFVIFEILAIPFTFFKLSFYNLRNTWLIIILLSTLLSLIINRKNLNDIYTNSIKEIKKFPKVLTGICILLVLFQAYMGFTYQHKDDDDSNFVAKAVIAYDTNTLFKYDDAGYELKKIPWRTGLSPFPWFTANIATLVKTHPTIVAHTIFPAVFVIIAYSLYYLIGKTLFDNDYKKTFTFLIILSFLYIFGNYTRYSIFVRLLTRLWQGKSILANISMPLIFYIFLKGIGTEKNNYYWFMLFIVLWGSVLLSSMALSLPIIVSGILTLLYMIKDKKISYILKYICCIMPCIGYGIIYLIIK